MVMDFNYIIGLYVLVHATIAIIWTASVADVDVDDDRN